MTATRRRTLPVLAAILSLAGIPIAGYLTWVHFDTNALVCGLGDCHTVQTSEFATVGSVPVALLGLAMYLLILGCMLAAMLNPDLEFSATLMAFGVALAGTIFAAYLTWIEIAVIHAICQWCVASAILTIVLTAVLGTALRRAFMAPVDGESETSYQRVAS